MTELAFDFGALLDGQRIVVDVAVDPRRAQHHQLARGNRTGDGTGEPRGLGGDAAFDVAAFALHERRALDVAFDPPVDVEVNGGADVALDHDIAADDREGRS